MDGLFFDDPKPNKALEPTPTSVTSPADAGAAPAAVVAHLWRWANNMAKLADQPFPDEDAWRLALGGFIWRMGQLEYLTYEWCLRLGGVGLRDAAITKSGFRGRYDLVVDAVASSAWSSDKKTKALRLWRAAKCFSAFRNKIAHAPVVEVRGVSVMLDARSLVGEGKRPVTVYRPEFIDSVSDHIQALAQKLDRTLESA